MKWPSDTHAGICCHEAGHAVVAWSFDLTVTAVRVAFTEEKGWHGSTETGGSDDHLPLIDRAAVWAAGYTAENVFDCPAHQTAERADLGQIATLFVAHGIPEQEHPALRAKANKCAEAILKTHKDKIFKLTERLVERGRVDRPEVLDLMQAADGSLPAAVDHR